jgi:hypothetical protein
MKKPLDPVAIANELRSGSLHFQRPQKTAPEPVQAPSAAVLPSPRVERQLPDPVPVERVRERSKERKKIHHSFDIFDDQLMSLRELVINREKKMRKRVRISELVQEALDDLFAKQ